MLYIWYHRFRRGWAVGQGDDTRGNQVHTPYILRMHMSNYMYVYI